MTQKLWIVCEKEDHKFSFDAICKSLEEAKEIARKYALNGNTDYEYFVLEAIHHFKSSVSVIETDLIAPKESLAVKPKFKIGDRVKHNKHGMGWIAEHRIEEREFYWISSVENFPNGGGFFGYPEDLTHA